VSLYSLTQGSATQNVERAILDQKNPETNLSGAAKNYKSLKYCRCRVETLYVQNFVLYLSFKKLTKLVKTADLQAHNDRIHRSRTHRIHRYRTPNIIQLGTVYSTVR